MNPSGMLRSAALGALALASTSTDSDFAPLVGAQAALGQTFPTQSPGPGQAALPNQLLIYGWDEKSETKSGNMTAPQFATTLTLVVEARVETKYTAAYASLPAQPSQDQIDNAVDGALDALCYAVKRAVCENIRATSAALNGNTPWVEEIRIVDRANRLAESGQRIAGNGAVSFEIVFTETFDPPVGVPMTLVMILTNPSAGAVANGGNTGNGTIASVAVGLPAQVGTYELVFSSATAFSVTAPDSSSAGSGTVGSQFSGCGLTFTVSAGTTPFIAGDGFAIPVQAEGQTQLNLS